MVQNNQLFFFFQKKQQQKNGCFLLLFFVRKVSIFLFIIECTKQLIVLEVDELKTEIPVYCIFWSVSDRSIGRYLERKDNESFPVQLTIFT